MHNKGLIISDATQTNVDGQRRKARLMQLQNTIRYMGYKIIDSNVYNLPDRSNNQDGRPSRRQNQVNISKKHSMPSRQNRFLNKMR